MLLPGVLDGQRAFERPSRSNPASLLYAAYALTVCWSILLVTRCGQDTRYCSSFFSFFCTDWVVLRYLCWYKSTGIPPGFLVLSEAYGDTAGAPPPEDAEDEGKDEWRPANLTLGMQVLARQFDLLAARQCSLEMATTSIAGTSPPI